MTAKWVASIVWLGLALALSTRLAVAYTSVGCFSNPASLTSDTQQSLLCAPVAPALKFKSAGVETETLTYRDRSTKFNLAPAAKPASADSDRSGGTLTDLLTEVPEPLSLGLLGGGLALIAVLGLRRRVERE